MTRGPESFEELRDAIYRSLARSACVPELHDGTTVTLQPEKRFFPAGTSETILTPNELERLFRAILGEGVTGLHLPSPARLAAQVKEQKLHIFLAVLIISNCDVHGLRSFAQRLISGPSLPNLPLRDVDSLRAIVDSEVVVDIFLQRQHEFFAPILQKHKEVKGDFRRLPYETEKHIGQGSFGKIYEVRISPGHYDAGSSTFNHEAKLVARKDFELNTQHYEKERDVLRDIIRSSKSHKNIMKSMGSFEIGTTYSIFMELAECDLMKYMEEQYPKTPETFAKKAELVHCAVGLAGAISFLHEELESPNYEKLSCFHMDLKPQNILVVIDSDGKQCWKLSDFNMSRVKMKRRPNVQQPPMRRASTFGDGVYEVNILFKRRYPEPSDASVTDYTINRRGQGTYLAPEACINGHPLQGESDTWSLGCVISVLFSYLYGGYEAVEEFCSLRSTRGSDCFFSFSNANEAPRLKDAHVNDAVKRWHKHLRMKSKQENPAEGAIFEDMVLFLGRKVLLIDPQQRRQTTAKDVRKQLVHAYSAYESLAMFKNVPTKAHNKRSSLKGIFKQTFQGRAANEEPEHSWRLQLSSTVKSCVFGPKAELFVCIAGNSILAYSLEHVLLTHDTGDFNENLVSHGQVYPNVKTSSWNYTVGVAGRYILAATDHPEFECYFYQVPQPGNHNSNIELISRWEFKLPRIWKLALSPDARYAAFVLCQGGTNPRTGVLYITSVDWLNSTNPENKLYSIVSSSSSSTTSSFSHPLGRAIPLPCPAEDVCQLSFSEVNGVYVVTKPRQSNDVTANTMRVYAWSIHEGRRSALAPSPIKHDGKDDILRGLFTFFAPYKRELAFAIVSQEKQLIIRKFEPPRWAQSSARGCRLLQILPDQDDRQFLAFGTQQANNNLRLFKFSPANLKDEFDLKDGQKLPGMTHESQFITSIATSSTGSLVHRHLLIAIMEDTTIRFVRISLDPL